MAAVVTRYGDSASQGGITALHNNSSLGPLPLHQALPGLLLLLTGVLPQTELPVRVSLAQQGHTLAMGEDTLELGSENTG